MTITKPIDLLMINDGLSRFLQQVRRDKNVSLFRLALIAGVAHRTMDSAFRGRSVSTGTINTIVTNVCRHFGLSTFDYPIKNVLENSLLECSADWEDC